MSESTPQAQPESDVEIVEEVPPSPAPFGVLESREPSPALTSSPTTPSLESTPAPAPPAAAAPASPAPPTPSAPTPSAPRPATPAPTPSRPTAPRPTALKRPAPQSGPPVRRTDPSKYGRIDAEGTVWLRTPAGDVVVGQWAAGTAEEGLAFFGRKYDDLLVEVDLAAYRLREGRGLDTAPTAVAHAREALAAPSFLGDIDELARACDEVDTLMVAARAAREEARARQREEALAAREAIVVEAESLAESSQWKATGERFTALLEAWKAAPRIDRGREQAMWKRFSSARTSFDRRRRQHFAARDAERKDAMAAKESLIREAEALSTSTDWAGTTRAYRKLMDSWKAAPRGSRQDEDRLWARFRAAQDAFFAARDAVNAERDVEHRANLERKQQLAAEAEAILPVSDIAAAKRALRSVQERWESVGHVPRADKERIDRRLKAVEDAVRQADDRRWAATDPARRARAEDTAEKFRASLQKAEESLAAARAKGDARAVAKAEATVESTRALLAAVEGTMSEFGGS
ncbi:MAG: DUF349 domain-containing protein [Candidatus Nanopelagicales bacterium]